MTHFNHDWDTTKTPAVPVSVGDRYYAQDLNDDFNYLKHLPYEVFLQGKSRGVMVAPSDTWNNDTNSLTLSGGFGVILQDCIELDPDEDFVIPPKTHSSPRYERIPLADTVLTIPTDNIVRYIVATPTKRSLLQRAKTLFTEQYASRVRYDGVIAIQDTAPTAGQILVGLCCNKEYCLLIDSNLNQCKDNIVLKKWFGQAKITQDFVPALQSYYDTSIASIETKIFIDTVSSGGISGGTFSNCTITIDTVSGSGGIDNGTFNNCTITINTIENRGSGTSGGTFNNCIITIGIVNRSNGINGGNFNNCTISTAGSGINNGNFNNCTISIVSNNISGGTFSNCTINMNTVSSRGINSGTFRNCTITIDAVSSGIGINAGAFRNCTIDINTINGTGIGSGNYYSCTITITTINSGVGIGGGIYNGCTITIITISGGSGIGNNNRTTLYLTRIKSATITDLSNTGGKLNVLNDTVLHTS